MVCDDGDCLRSAYYGIAKYGCSYYGIVMPLLPASLSYGYQGAADLTYGYQGDTALTFGVQGTVTIGFEETQEG